MKGIGKLQTPSHLLAKLQHDFARLTADPGDSYVAFDFFITAEHMLDWVLPGYDNDEARKNLISTSVVLEAVSHIANSSKHHVAQARRHQHVQHVDAPPSVFDSDAFDNGAFETGALLITLEGRAESVLGRQLPALDLASRVLRFWEKYLAENENAAGGHL